MKDASKNIAPEKQLIDRVYWLTNLRWIAVAGVVATVYSVSRFFRIPLAGPALYGVVAFLAICNGLVAWAVSYLKDRQLFKAIKAVANLQILLDLTCLALLIHFSGGVENPFYFYFIFHIIIAGILLSRRETFVLATYAVVIFLFIVAGEYFGFLTHHCIREIFLTSLHENAIYLLAIAFVFVSTLYIAAFLTTSISSRLREREQSLRAANELLAEKDRIKSEYVLRVTHDLKEDLAAISTCVEPVQKGLTGPLNAEQINLLSRTRERSKHLIVYVDALLEITKLKLTEKIEMTFFSVVDLVREITESLTPLAEENRVVFEVRLDPKTPSMKGVRIYIQEALLNLLKNSLKYTPTGGTIAWDIQSDGKWLRIKIADTGIGISREDLPRIFDEFYRAKNAKAIVKKGTGLGLSITQKIVEMHHGKIWIESELGKGTCVNLEIPLVST